jgi:hypothetical protein
MSLCILQLCTLALPFPAEVGRLGRASGARSNVGEHDPLAVPHLEVEVRAMDGARGVLRAAEPRRGGLRLSRHGASSPLKLCHWNTLFARTARSTGPKHHVIAIRNAFISRPRRNRTADQLLIRQPLSPLSYRPSLFSCAFFLAATALSIRC